MTDDLHPSHITRSSDASTYDFICVFCGHTDRVTGGSGKLVEPCPFTLTLTDVTAVIANEDPVKVYDTYGIDITNLTEEQVEKHQNVFKRLIRRYGPWSLERRV